MESNELEQQAKSEVEEEERRKKIEEIKLRLKRKRKLWNMLFPWKIAITRKDSDG